MILFDRKILNKKDIKIFYIKIKMYRKFIYFCSTNQLFINYKKNYIMLIQIFPALHKMWLIQERDQEFKVQAALPLLLTKMIQSK